MKGFLHNCKSSIFKYKQSGVMIISGLSLAYAIILLLFLKFDFGYSYNSSIDRNIYRLELYDSYSKQLGPYLSKPIADLFKSSIPGLNQACIFSNAKIRKARSMQSSQENNIDVLTGYADSSLTQVFDLKCIAINKDLYFDKSAILPKSIAIKIFGKPDVVGEKFLSDEQEYVVSAVYNDLPPNSTLKNAIYLLFTEDDRQKWIFFNYYKIDDADKVVEIEERIADLIRANDEFNADALNLPPKLRSIREIYFTDVGNLSELISLTFIAFIVLIVAMINFINFTISISPVRTKSLNLHLIFGAGVKKLRYFIVFESILFSILSYLISILLVYGFSLTSFSYLLGVPFSLSYHPELYGLGFIMSALIGFLAGIYPGFFMLNFQPALALKVSSMPHTWIHKLKMFLLSFQFIISTSLLVVAMFVFLQIRFVCNNDRGFESENVVFFKMDPLIDKQRNALSSLLLQNNKIADVCFSSRNWGNFEISNGERVIDGETQLLWLHSAAVSGNFCRFFNIKMHVNPEEIAGPYSIVNQSLAELIGEEMVLSGDFSGARVKGISCDFNFQSLKKSVQPAYLHIDDNNSYSYCFIKLNSKIEEMINNEYIKSIVQQIIPGASVEIKNLKSHLTSYYDQDEDLSKLINVLCLISLLIAMMGLYGLISFHFNTHARNIAIRKVFGAGLSDVFKLFSKNYILIYLISFCLAAPVAFIIIQQWLNNFAYKINISLIVFLLAGLFMLFVISGLLYYYTNKIFSLSTEAMIKNK
ncbi:MAG: FtsX-like permease family protein [Bacteroidales bacterium]